MRQLNIGFALLAVLFAGTLTAQNGDMPANAPETTLKVNSRAVLVDVIVTDHNGNPVRGSKNIQRPPSRNKSRNWNSPFFRPMSSPISRRFPLRRL
jgi:hypothetical protein